METLRAALGPFADELVFVGGAIVWLLLTDRATITRSTLDVDAIIGADAKFDGDLTGRAR